MKRLILVFMLLVVLFGCNVQYSGEVIRNMVKFCESHGGLSYLQKSDRGDYAKCNDKSEISLSELQ